MRTWRLPLSLAVLPTLVLLFSIALTHSATAQIVQCISCVGTDVTPDGGTATVSANSTQNNLTFTVSNTGTLSGTFTFTCSATGNVTCGPAPASRVIGPGGDALVNLTFNAGATGTGVITLTASGGTTDTGFYNITVQGAAGPPVVALRNYDGNNIDRSLCLTVGAGEAGAAVCGDLVVTHSMPGYATMGRERSLTLVYNSASARPQPVLTPAITEGGSVGIPNTVLVELSVAGVIRKTVTFPGSAWSSSGVSTRQVSISYDAVAAGQATGAYPFSLRVQNVYTGSSIDAPLITGTLLVVNRNSSEFGRGVWLAGVEQLVIANQPNGGILWVGGDGSVKLYSKVNSTTWRAPLGLYQDTVKLISSQYVRAPRHGVTVTFDAQGRHIKTTNRAGHVTTFNWNTTTNRLTSIVVPPGGTGTTYNLVYASSLLDYITDPAGRKLDASIVSGELRTLVDPDLQSTLFAYATTGLMNSRTNRRGYATLYEYANNLRLTKVTVPVGRTASDPATAVTQFTPWDERGISTPLDTAKAYTRVQGPRFPTVSDTAAIWVDSLGGPTKIVNPLGFVTLFERTNTNVPGKVTRVTYPNAAGGGPGEIVLMFYDNRGNLTQVRDSTWHLSASVRLRTKATMYTYGTGTATSPLDSPIKIIDSTEVANQPLVTTYAYTSFSLPLQVTSPNGHVTTFGYDGQHLLNAVTEVSVPTWNQSSKAEPAANLTTTFKLNELGNDTNIVSPTGRITRHLRDQFQRVMDEYDPAGHQLTYTYDELNRTRSVTEHVGTANLVTQTAYNIDVVSSVIDPRGVPRSWQYDNAGRQIAETDDFNHTELRFYNAAGQLDSVRQRVFEGATGAVIRYTYDAAGRQQKMVWPSRPYPRGAVPGDSVLYTYDNRDRMLTATTTGTFVNVGDTISFPRKITRTYFARGELQSEVQSRANGTVGYRNTYSYDRMGRRTSYVMGTPANVNFSDSLAYTYKTTGELNSIRMRWRGDPPATPSDSAVFFWDALGRRDSVRLSNNPYVKFAYDGDGALRLVCGSNNGSATTNVLKFTYNNAAVDGEGLVTSTATTIPTSSLGCSSNSTLAYTQTNAYDGRHQLTTMTRSPGESHTYVYDASGNMDQDNQPVNPDFDYVMLAGHNQVERRVPSVGTITRYLYDANGSRAFECSGTTGCDTTTLTYRKYYYDGLGRMVGTDEHLGNPPPPVYTPEYDPVGRMLQAPDLGINFGFDGDNIVRTRSDSSTGNIWTFVHGPGTDDPLIAHMVQLNGQWQINLTKTAYFATDGQGRQYGVGDAAGNDLSGPGYFMDNGGKYAGGTLNAATFAADRSTSNTMKQLSFFRNRFYDQQSGRWTQEDPIGVAGGVNLYQFNGNNPVSNTDPFGLCFGPLIVICPALIEGAMYALGAIIAVAAINDVSDKVGGDGGDAAPAAKPAGNSPADAPGQTAGGKATDQYGNALGPSGNIQVDVVNESTRKRAKDAARDYGSGPPIHHPSPARGKPHFHPTDANGNKIPGAPHFTYP